MLFSRAGLELTEIWHRQTNLLESDARLRKLQRAAANDPEKREEYRRALHRLGPDHHEDLIQAGFSGDVMAHHVREHAKATRAYDKARDAGEDLRDSAQKQSEARWAIRRHHQDHGDHPADHARRGKDETPRQFGDRLRAFTLTNSTVYGHGSSEHGHGMISYAHDSADEHGHIRNRQAMARAWEREVPEGHTTQHNKTHGDGTVRGSVINFMTGPRPRPRRGRRR